ncbi:MAG: ferritin-like domain-containing protein [Chthoniobacterales bacterium]
MNIEQEVSTNHKTPIQSLDDSSVPQPMPRRSFLRRLGVGAALLAPGAAFLGQARAATAEVDGVATALPAGDVALLRFLAAAELIETDLWQQYTELALGNPAYEAALGQLDEDMGQYISDNTDDELSHANFLNAFLQSRGESPVNLDAFRTLPSSQATGAQQIGRLTNLTNLTVDTSFWIRYRSPVNPDFENAAAFPQFIEIVNFPAIPSQDLPMGSPRLQAIANTAAFHFCTIEQGGTSLYASLVRKASRERVVKIIAGIGGSEVNHFAIWHDKAGNAPAVTVPGVSFPDMKDFEGDKLRQKNLIMPEPCEFISADLPLCSIVRPTTFRKAGATAAVHALRMSGLFSGQSQNFFRLLSSLARAADAAERDSNA